jgi:type IV secretion system protein VirB10
MADGSLDSDPRPQRSPDDVRPLVASTRRDGSTLLIAGVVVGAALVLFLLLDGHRRALQTPAVRATRADLATAAGPPVPPPLYVPPVPVPPPAASAPEDPPPAAVTPPAPPRVVYVPQPAPAPPVPAQPPAPVLPARGDQSALVIDNTVGDGSPPAQEATGANAANSSFGSATTAAPNARVRATMFADRTTTVPQGTLIPAVLETAFNSTRPGLARALVSRDVRGFDGSRVLIPRGSRLTGEYRSDVSPGQHRALIVWTRLVRPDGALIALASPAADTLGRGGVRGKVNTHFLARFTGAILQTALDVGVNLASRPTTGAVVLGLPGSSIGSVPNFLPSNQVTNTLTVRAGTSIGVLVSRDLDFADVEGHP